METLLGRQAAQGLDFEALETAARQQGLRVAAGALEGWLNADTSDPTGSQLPCAGGAQAQYRGRHEQSFRKRSRSLASGASVVLLREVPERLLPTRPRLEVGRLLLVAGGSAHGGECGYLGQLRRE